jgi:hypothetical protein
MALLDAVNLRQSSARSLRPSKRTVEHQGTDRVCDEPTCTTQLSRYNPAASCSVHAGWADPAKPRRRKRAG